MPPFEYQPYRSPYVGSMAELMLEPGRAQAQAAQVSGQAWGQAAQQIGQGIAGAVQQAVDPRRQLEQQHLEANKRALQINTTVNQLMTSAMVTHPDGYITFDRGKLRQMFAQSNVPIAAQEATFESLDKVDASMQKFAAARTDSLADLAHGVLTNGATQGALTFGIALAKANHRLSDEELQPLIEVAASGGDLKGPLQQIRGMSEKYKELSKPIVLPRPGSKAIDASGNVLGEVPAPAARPVVVPQGGTAIQPDTGAVLATGTPRDEPTVTIHTVDNGKPVTKVLPKSEAVGQTFPSPPPASVQVNTAPAAVEARTNNAQQLVDGNMPPSMLSKRATDYNATLAEANKLNIARTGKPLNIGKLQLDYEGAKKFVAGMNSTQMIRYRSLSDSVVNTIDEVQRLADELQQGGVQKWNQVKRSTIRQVYGNTPQSELANQYVGALNTLKEEFANLANGGYAPTDAAWKLANDQINADFGFKDLRASLTEVQRLINFRTHALQSQQAYQPSIQTAPGGSPAPPGAILYDSNGNRITSPR